MRIVTPEPYKVYTFDELSPQAQQNARDHMYDQLSEMGIITNDMRTLAADWLTNEGWTDLAELRWDENGPDLSKMQFQVSHSQGDFVAWASTRPWDHNGTEIIVKTTMVHRGGGSVFMEVDIVDDEGDSIYDGSDLHDQMERKAKEMVYEHSQKVLQLVSSYDLDFTDEANNDYFQDYAQANRIEFTEAGAID